MEAITRHNENVNPISNMTFCIWTYSCDKFLITKTLQNCCTISLCQVLIWRWKENTSYVKYRLCCRIFLYKTFHSKISFPKNGILYRTFLRFYMKIDKYIIGDIFANVKTNHYIKITFDYIVVKRGVSRFLNRSYGETFEPIEHRK